MQYWAHTSATKILVDLKFKFNSNVTGYPAFLLAKSSNSKRCNSVSHTAFFTLGINF